MEWEPDKPRSLLEICTHFCVDNVAVLCDYKRDKDEYSLREGISLPSELCERLMEGFCENHGTETYLRIFRDCDRTKLKRLLLRDSPLGVSEETIRALLKHKLTEMDIIGCPSVKHLEVIHDINAFSHNLTSLHLSQYHLFEDIPLQHLEEDSGFKENSSNMKFGVDYIFDCPKLKVFGIQELHATQCLATDIIRVAIKPMVSLSQLDLSYCQIEFETMNCITNLQSLLSLILYEVPIKNINGAFSIISKLKKLRGLDLSQGQENPVQYEDSTDSLSFLVQQLPNLNFLDLSGTNLPGFQKEKSHSFQVGLKGEDSREIKAETCSIPGLEGKRLQFLGLLGCAFDACTRDHLPAKKVTGDANEEQIINAALMYVEKQELLINSLNSLFKIFRFSECHDQRGALEGILNAMKRWPADKSVQICGSASLFYIVKGEKRHSLNSCLKKRIIKAIITGMEHHMDESTMMRNGCLTMCHFKIPQDVLFVYEDLVTILLKMVAPPGQEEFVQRIGIYLLNSLACQVEGKEKQLVGDLGAISTMLDIIRHKLANDMCDEVMEIAWSTMWNVTDETSLNCERFIDEGGMQIFLLCLQKFPEKDELLRNMMGLLGNIAEVPFLRCKLMQSEFVSVFSNLLESTSDGIEVSYNACGVLSHMVSDGELAWSLSIPSRQEVLQKMVDAISRWKLRTKRNINYRSFEPILRLLPRFDTPECQHWAVWALCNLTKMYRHKYCPLLKKENGLYLLEEIINDTRPYDVIKELAQDILNRFERFNHNPETMTDNEDGMDMEPEPDEHHF